MTTSDRAAELGLTPIARVHTAVLAGATLLGGLSATAVSFVVVTLVLLLALKFGRYVSAIVDSKSPEVFLLRVLGAALLVAGVAQQRRQCRGRGADSFLGHEGHHRVAVVRVQPLRRMGDGVHGARHRGAGGRAELLCLRRGSQSQGSWAAGRDSEADADDVPASA